MALREVQTDPEVLFHAINDGINEFINEVLIPQGLIDEDAYAEVGRAFHEQKHQIVRLIVRKWKTSQVDDSV